MPSFRGLTSKQALQKLQSHGLNVLPEKVPPSGLVLLLRQVKSPLVYILIGAAGISFVLAEFTDVVIITLAVLINSFLGFFQERRAGRALMELKKLLNPQTKVVRDGVLQKIPVTEVVVGDLCILSQGDKVPADGKLISVNRLFIAEALLTGESIPVEKENSASVFMGTIVMGGRGEMLVETSGKDTEIGKIALSVQELTEETPLTRQIKTLSRQLTYVVISLTVFVFLLGIVTGKNVLDVFETSVALAVSAIPEGLLIGLTVVLAVGMQRILKRKGLVRNLVSAETLGGVTTICVDKTGTLTKGELTVVDFIGDTAKAAVQAVIANDLDDPIATALYSWGQNYLRTKSINHDSLLKANYRIDSIPFSSHDKYFVSLNLARVGENMLLVNGAPEILLEWTNLSSSAKKTILTKLARLTRDGKRVVGLARKTVNADYIKINTADIKDDLTWVGLAVFSDPVRKEVKLAIDQIVKAGIKMITITGDYPNTALAVLKELGIELTDDQYMTGEELAKIDDKTLLAKINSGVKLFARTTPGQKLTIVEVLKQGGEIVAMTGDGVNDAPALTRADIGIVVAGASDVAKESADLVLLDSSFLTISAAIEEGRGIYENIRKILLYLLSDAFEEIIIVIGTLLLGLPLPITVSQILWINLVSDGFPHLALTIDPKSKNSMAQKPRLPSEKLITPWMTKLMLVVSALGGLFALGLFMFYFKTTGNLILARSIAFAALGVNSLVYVFSVRTLASPFWESNPFQNRWLNYAVLAGLVLQIVPFTTSFGRNIFNIVALTLSDWLVVFGSSVLVFIVIEVIKVMVRFDLKQK